MFLAFFHPSYPAFFHLRQRFTSLPRCTFWPWARPRSHIHVQLMEMLAAMQEEDPEMMEEIMIELMKDPEFAEVSKRGNTEA